MINGKNIEMFTEILLSRHYSVQTVKTYSCCVEYLSNYYDKNTRDITNHEIQDYIIHFTLTLKKSSSYQNQFINAVKLYYKLIHNKTLKPKYIERPRESYCIPEILSVQEIENILFRIKNLKHKAIIATIYFCGLRISELINLKISDVSSKEMRVFIRQGKGKKDRKVLLQEQLLEILKQYYLKYKPINYLFNGQNSPIYSKTSIRNILNNALTDCGIIKSNIKVHSLRHSFASHLLELGIDIRVIQEVLGHSSIKATERYLHITNKAIDKTKLITLKIAS